MTDSQTAPSLPPPDRRDLRKFGLVMGAMIGVLFGLVLPWLFDRPYPIWPWIVFAVLGLMGLLIPLALRPVYQAWMRFALLLGKVTTPLILGVAFILVITPIGLIMRAAGKDPMRRKWDQAAQSYRVDSIRKKKESLENPY